MGTQELAGTVCLVTGAGAGIGRATAAGLAEKGATVVAMVRDVPRGQKMVEEIRKASGNEKVELLECDLSSQQSVRDAAAKFKLRHPKLHVLIHQAGLAPPKHTLTPDGVELTMAVNHHAAFLLTEQLRDVLVASAPSRVIVGTGGISNMGKIDFDDLDSKKAWKPFRVLAQSKLANVLFTAELARRLKGTGVTANLFDPMSAKTDFAKGSGGVMGAMMALARLFAPTPDKVAQDMVHLATAPALAGVTGRYFLKRKEQNLPKTGQDPEIARRLWEVSERVTGTRAG
ncbi:MAG: SDR family oxidoreductase [Myxococcota bacterium]|nr:SDR family oxidoreductase [Myxococcota bacterium]